ncbi:MAG: class I adenylate-forming enzyme family protein, partial [Rhodospirillales bacterium]|nr:class I adenylate-forming enzyme family protein [Rhodospirillales bacterium]
RTNDSGGLITETHFGRTLTCFAERPRNIGAMLCATAARHSDGDAVIDGRRRLSYAELLRRAEGMVVAMHRVGLARGDRVGIWSGNRWEAIAAVVACLRAEFVAVPLGHRLQTDEVDYMLNDSGAKALIVDDVLAARVPGKRRLPDLRHVFPLTDKGVHKTFAADAASEPGPPPVGNEETLAFLMYTSGTTGRPKGAMITHFNLAHSVLHYIRGMRLSDKLERTLLAVPFTHITGLVAQILTMFACAGAIVVQREFKADAAVRLLRDERVTHAVMVPAMYNLMLRSGGLEAAPLPCFRIGAYGGAPMPPALTEEIHRRLPGLELMNAYGSTETTSPATLLPAADAVRRRDSVGLPMHCAEIFVCDEEGRELPPGSVGELRIGGPMVVPGYWNLPEVNRDTFGDGSWRSGDIGRIDADGYVEVLDRSKDMINRAGYKVYSAEVEGLLVQHPEVAEAAVVARPCPVLGERVHAFVTVTSDQPTARELTHFVAARIADYKVPETFTLQAEPLPRNANGKIVKSSLRARALAEIPESVR